MSEPIPQLTNIQMAWLNLNGYQVEDSNNKSLRLARWKSHIVKLTPEAHRYTDIAQCGGIFIFGALLPSVSQQPTCKACINWVRRRVSG